MMTSTSPSRLTVTETRMVEMSLGVLDEVAMVDGATTDSVASRLFCLLLDGC